MKRSHVLILMSLSSVVCGMEQNVSLLVSQQPLFVEIVLHPRKPNELVMQQRTIDQHLQLCVELQKTQQQIPGVHIGIHPHAMFAFTTSLLLQQLSQARQDGVGLEFVQSQIDIQS